jgi:dynactin complex subunit
MTTSNHRTRDNDTDAQLRDMLRAERLALTRRAIVLKGEIRERVGELEEVERRLAEIETSEHC